jgi:hypothetical protein
MQHTKPVCSIDVPKVRNSSTFSRGAEVQAEYSETLMHSSWFLRGITNKRQAQQNTSARNSKINEIIGLTKECFRMWHYLWPCLLYSGSACVLQVTRRESYRFKKFILEKKLTTCFYLTPHAADHQQDSIQRMGLLLCLLAYFHSGIPSPPP